MTTQPRLFAPTAAAAPCPTHGRAATWWLSCSALAAGTRLVWFCEMCEPPRTEADVITRYSATARPVAADPWRDERVRNKTPRG